MCIVGPSGRKGKSNLGNGKNHWECCKKLILMLLSEGLEKVLVSFALCSSKLGTVLCVGTVMHSLKVKKPVWSKTPQV